MQGTQGRKIAAAMSFSVALAILTFVLGPRDYAAVFWIIIFAVTIAALVAAIRSQDSASGSGASKK